MIYFNFNALFTNVLFQNYASIFTYFLLWIYVLSSLYKVLKYFYSLFLAFYWISQLFFVLLFLLMVETSMSLFLVITSTFKLLLYEWVKSLSRVRLFATPWITACQASLSITNSWSSHKPMCIKSVMPSSQSHPLLSPSPPDPNFSQHQSLFQWVNSSHQVAKVLEFQLQHQSFQWTPRIDLL